jgi:hypothetical protein
MGNGPFIDDFPIKTSIYKGFSMAMLNNQMVIAKYCERHLQALATDTPTHTYRISPLIYTWNL